MAWKLDIAGYPRFDTSTVINVIAGFYDGTKVDAQRLAPFLEIKISGATALSLSACVAAVTCLLF